MAEAVRKNPVTDTMEGVGNTAGTIQDGTASAGNAVGADKVGSAAGGAVTSGGDAVGGAASGAAGAVGAEPKQVGVLGGGSVPTALKCVVNLTCQYLGIYTAIAIIRVVADFQGTNANSWTIYEALVQATLTVNYAPMLAIMFLACRMRVTWLTQGKGNPPTWVQMWMYASSYAVLALTLIALCVPLFTGEKVKFNERGELDENDQPFKNKFAALGFTILKYLIMIGLYVGAICIIYGTYTYVPPAGSWPGDTIPPVSPAVGCTMILASMYFLVYAGIQFGKTFQSFSGIDSSKVTGALDGATNSMFFAPMLAVLFIGARMRALQMDPVNGAPQKWAQNCFFMCTYALALQTCLCIAIPLVLNGKVEKGELEGDMKYTVEGTNAAIGGVLTVVRFLIMIGIYIGFSCVIYSIFTIEHPAGPQYTPPISVTMKCVINLTVQFFAVYLLIWIAETVRNYLGTFWIVTMIGELMENAKGTINFCPMLAILFVGTRMRALWITNNRGAPQGWVQDGMYMATWAVLIQFLMVLVVAFTTGSKDVECDADGTPKWNPSGSLKILQYVALALKWVTFIF